MSLLTLLAFTGTNDAEACGGFACSQSRPVLQAAERIVFGIDEHGGDVEMHVQITYEGDAEDFAWIVPVAGEPDLFLTTGALFTRLGFALQPSFNLTVVEEGHCSDGIDLDLGIMQEYSINSDAAPMSAQDSGGVTVVGEEAIGPYETVTLQAESSEALLAWLETNHFDLPPQVDDALAPYVTSGAYFVALKLRKNRDAGDLAPLGLRYEAQKGMIPVQLTSVSATPDMRMEAYVFSNTRAVPESYLHVQINDAAIDWWNAGANYDDVITQAADEAGGHAFATDFYGETDLIRPFWFEGSFDEAALRSAPNASAWMERLRPALGAPPPELYTLVENLFGVPTGQGSQFYVCPDCVSSYGFTAGAATDALITEVVEPMRSAQALLDNHRKVTRMTSSLDAVEMTVDPIFVLNHDMVGPVPRIRRADFVYECGNGRARSSANRRLALADGRAIDIPSEEVLNAEGISPFMFIADLGLTKAQIIEETGAEGVPRVITDHTEDFFELARLHNNALGFGCSTTGIGGVGFATGLAGLFVSRRRRVRG